MTMSAPDRMLQGLVDRAEIDAVIHTYSTAVDTRNWLLLRSIFADEAIFDVRSWTGGEARQMRSDDWVEWVAAMLSGFDATCHYTTNHVHSVEGERATCASNMIALHYLVEGEARAMHASFGTYTRSLTRTEKGWIIDAHQLVIKADLGERDLHRRAQARWAAGSQS